MQARGARTGAADQDGRACDGFRRMEAMPHPCHGGVAYSVPDPCPYPASRTAYVTNLTIVEDSAILVVHSSREGSPTWLWRTGEAESGARDGYLGRVSLCHMIPPARTRRASRSLLLDARTPHGRGNLRSSDYHNRAHEVERLPTLQTARRKGQEPPHTRHGCCTSQGGRILTRMSTLGRSKQFVAEEPPYAGRSVSR